MEQTQFLETYNDVVPYHGPRWKEATMTETIHEYVTPVNKALYEEYGQIETSLRKVEERVGR